MKPKTSSSTEDMPSPQEKAPPLPRKLGANRGETAKIVKKRDNNFKQSTDLREDRGIRQNKSAPKNRVVAGRNLGT